MEQVFGAGPESGTVEGCSSGQEEFTVFSASNERKGPPGFMDFEVLWLVGNGLGRPTTYQKMRSGLKGDPTLWTQTCAKNAFSHRNMHKVGSAPMAISRQRSGIFSNGQKWRIGDCSEHTNQQKSRHRFLRLFQR